MGDKNEGMYVSGGGEWNAPLTTRLVRKAGEGKTSHVLSWKAERDDEKNTA